MNFLSQISFKLPKDVLPTPNPSFLCSQPAAGRSIRSIGHANLSTTKILSIGSVYNLALLLRSYFTLSSKCGWEIILQATVLRISPEEASCLHIFRFSSPPYSFVQSNTFVFSAKPFPWFWIHLAIVSKTVGAVLLTQTASVFFPVKWR